jgi:hypothetical protein
MPSQFTRSMAAFAQMQSFNGLIAAWTRSFNSWPTSAVTSPVASNLTSLFDSLSTPEGVTSLAAAPYSAYRSSGGHAMAQIVMPIADQITVMARMNPAVAAFLPAPTQAALTPSTWLATLPTWRFFNA